jgi:hypothetical protein
VPEPRRRECWWLVLRDGTLIRGDEGGAVRLLAEIGWTRALAAALRRGRLSPALDAIDRVMARSRQHIGRFVPDGPAPRRYP